MKPKPCKRCGGTGEEPDRKTTGAEVKEARLSKGQPRHRVAKLMRISVTFLHDLEAGSRNWTPALKDKAMRAIDSLPEVAHPHARTRGI
jgi:hypothetical protein